jgi:hypothetical protein
VKKLIISHSNGAEYNVIQIKDDTPSNALAYAQPFTDAELEAFMTFYESGTFEREYIHRMEEAQKNLRYIDTHAQFDRSTLR